MNIGERIKLKRKEKRLTQKELSQLVNTSPQVISNWERGYTSPNHDDVARLSEALDCSTEFLHGRTDSKISGNRHETLLTEKDKKDIARRMEEIKKDLMEGNSDGEGLSFKGEPMSEEAMQSLLESLEILERQTTLINKKYIPKKNRRTE